MSPFPLIVSLSDVTAVGPASVQSGMTMVKGQRYFVVADCAMYVQQGANPTATAADGSCFLPANCPILIEGIDGAKIATIHPSATGFMSVTPVRS